MMIIGNRTIYEVKAGGSVTLTPDRVVREGRVHVVDRQPDCWVLWSPAPSTPSDVDGLVQREELKRLGFTEVVEIRMNPRDLAIFNKNACATERVVFAAPKSGSEG